jgi:hypothetical protein
MRSGRVQASCIADDGRRYYCTHTFDTRMDAEGWLHQERKLIDRGEWTPPEMPVKHLRYVTLADYCAEWMAHRDLSPTTRAVYEDLLRLRIVNHLGDEMLQAITPAVIRAWWVKLGKDTPVRNAHAYRVLVSIFNTAIQDKLIKENPVRCRTLTACPAPAMSSRLPRLN